MNKANITIKIQRPPFWILLKLFFPAYNPRGTVAVAFGRVVYANQDFSEDFKIHEETHLIQQKRSYLYATYWWIKYVFSRKFRFYQELDAFRRQYRFVKENKGRDLHLAEWAFAGSLASPLYGNLVSVAGARNLIRDDQCYQLWKKEHGL